MNRMEKKKFSFQTLLDNPIAFIAPAYPYVIAVIVVIGLYFVSNINAVYLNKTTVMLPDTVVVADLPLQGPRSDSAVDISMIQSPDQAFLDLGKKEYESRCATCHGAGGKGDGPGGTGLAKPPRNFTSNDGWVNGKDLAGMYLTLEKGIPPFMAAYSDIAPDIRLAMIHYMRTFMTDPPAITEGGVKLLDDTYKLTAGSMQPGTLPLQEANSLVLSSASKGLEKLNAALSVLEQKRTTDGGAKIFYHSVINPGKAIGTLLNDNSWRESSAQFRAVLSRSFVVNGFKPAVVTLSETEFTLLWETLKAVTA